MRRLLTIGLSLALLFALFAATGCARISYEFESKHFMAPDPTTLFIGEEYCEHLLPSPLAFIMLPGELLADVIFMPMELFRRSYHALFPPLTEYIYKFDFEGLERKLKDGADPNAVSTRNYWKDRAKPPLVYAKARGALEATRILAKYGAKATPELFSWGADRFNIYQFIFDSGIADDIDFSADNKDIVIRWTRYILSTGRRDELDAISSCIAQALNHGASPNELDSEGLYDRTTALDLLARAELNGVDVSGLVKIMKDHGALTYDELVKIHPELPTSP
ncbi:MAG: hypothetical protein IJS15_04090 [Victivallales bacterium]|nr:hypothetical protein [Victivallales bacterium]